MLRTSPVDGFQLAYERAGSGPPVILLHGWPGDHADYRRVMPLLSEHADVIAPDLRGFGESDKHGMDPVQAYSAAAQARSVLGLIDELGLEHPVVAGYDIGSRIAQAMAHTASDRLRAIVISPPLPGAGSRVLTPAAHLEYWYQSFHQLDLAEQLIDGNRDAARQYIGHFWSHWSGPAFRQPDEDLDRLADLYSKPGAFVASIGWYRAGSGTVARSLAETTPDPSERISVHTTVLWPEHDPLFPPEWGDRIDDFFSQAATRPLPGAGHFVPAEAPDILAATIRELI